MRPELLRQALTQRAQTKLASGKGTGRLVATQRSRSASEDDRPLLPKLILLLFFERQDRLPSEAKSSSDVRFQALTDLLLLDIEEPLPKASASVEYRAPDRSVGPLRANLAESIGESGVVIGRDYER